MAKPRKPRIRSRRIVERPRLIHALDSSDARVRLLVAGPGYGKTVLLEEWAEPRDGTVAWFRAMRSAADVSVVARALVDAAAAIVPGAGQRLLQRLAVTDDPERETVLLAEMLAEDLDGWPESAWLVIDDYQCLAAARASETFVATVVDGSPVRLVVSSRVRPSWLAGPAILGGEAFELSEQALAMTAEEAAELLDGARAELGAGLVALAGGWPVVVGLAAMLPDAGDADAEQPETLYEFFAEELYRALDSDVRKGLAILGELPLLDHELAVKLLGAEQAEKVCGHAVSLGLLDDREGRFEIAMFPEGFLERRADMLLGAKSTVMTDASAHYRGRGDLDAAFAMTRRAGEPEDVDQLVAESMDALLGHERIPTLERWVAHAAGGERESTTLQLAQAEIALREGRHLTALALSGRIPSDGDPSATYRAYLVAARAAHVGGREQEALSLFRRAEGVAPNESARRRAKWGQVTAGSELELDSAQTLLDELTASADKLDATELVQASNKRLLLGLRFGAVQSVPEAKECAQLLSSVPDPFLRCSFGSTLSCALNLAAEYEHALEAAMMMSRDAAQHRVRFAMPYALLMSAAALAGMRRFDEAHATLAESLRHAERCADRFAQQAVYAGRVRALLHEHRIAEACALEPPDLTDSLPGMRGEVIASRGLALACLGRLDEAVECASRVRGSTRAVEPATLLLCIDAITALKRRDARLSDALRRLVHGAFEAGAVDYVVTSYRGSPDLLVALLRDFETAESTGYIVTRSSDHALAESMGVDALAALDPASKLTPREREVYALICDGLANDEIARRLFISQATVKAHARRVYRKTGHRSRIALALDAAGRRGQATSAADGSASSETDG